MCNGDILIVLVSKCVVIIFRLIISLHYNSLALNIWWCIISCDKQWWYLQQIVGPTYGFARVRSINSRMDSWNGGILYRYAIMIFEQRGLS